MSQTDSPLGTAPVGKLVLQLAIPAMLAQFVNILYSVVDRMYVGHIAGAGDAALAGVGVCAPVVTMIRIHGEVLRPLGWRTTCGTSLTRVVLIRSSVMRTPTRS